MITIPDRMVFVHQTEFLSKTENEIREETDGKGHVWLVELTDPLDFLAWLQPGFKPPMQGNPHSGLPRNVWAGVRLGSAPYADPLELLEVRSAVRWVDLEPGLPWEEITGWYDVVQAWRCSNCGTRGTTPRPRLCPHAAGLCGDARIDPQIHVVMTDALIYDEDANVLTKLGIALWPSLASMGLMNGKR